jgi:serine/threonine-protein kinase
MGHVVDRLLLVEPLVRDGIATAYRGLQLPSLLEVEVALAGPNQDEEVHRNLYREALALGRLGHHPNITRLVSFGTEGPVTWLAFEGRGDARTLAELFGVRGQQPVGAAAARLFLEPLSAALGALARWGLIHGEIRPEAVAVSAPIGHRAFVTLGGFVRVPDPEPPAAYPTRQQVWRAPEQLLRSESGPSTDAYAVAAIAFRLLVGREPFPGDDRERLFWAKQHPAFDPLKGLSLPDRAASFFARALAQDPGQRFESWLRFADGLEAALHALEVEPAHPVVPPAPPPAVDERPADPPGWRTRREPPRTRSSGARVETPIEEGEGEVETPVERRSGSTVVMSAEDLMAAAEARGIHRMHRNDSHR